MEQPDVLILVLVEDGLVDVCIDTKQCYTRVLILVLVEDGLVVGMALQLWSHSTCLNPCFSGGWSSGNDN